MAKSVRKAKSLKEIAQELDMHPSSISKIINSETGFSRETREKVMKKIREYNYRPNDAAIALKYSAVQPYRLVILVTDFNSTFITTILSGLESRIRENNLDQEEQPIEMLVYSHRSEENTAVKDNSILKNIVRKRPSAIISVTAPVPPEIYAECAGKGIPMILIEDNAGGSAENVIGIDNFKAGAAAAARLLEWQCERLAFISGPLRYRAQNDRCEGFKAELEKRGFPVTQVHFYHGAALYTLQEGADIYNSWLTKTEGIKGVFCAAGDTIAAGIYSTMLRDSGRYSFKLIGFDGGQIRDFYRFPTFIQPLAEFADKSFNMALSAMKYGLIDNAEYRKMVKQSACEFTFDQGFNTPPAGRI